MIMATDSKAYGSPIVRPAEIADSRQAAELIYRTGEGLFKYLFYPFIQILALKGCTECKKR